MESRVVRRFVVGAACLTIPLSIGATQHPEYVSAAGGALVGGAGHAIHGTLGRIATGGIRVTFGGGDGAPGVD